MINKSKKNILVTAPYLDNIGGTEIEAILMAMYLYDTNKYKDVAIFSPAKTTKLFFSKVIGQRDIKFLHYPYFFKSKIVTLINKVGDKLGFKTRFFEYLFWFFISIRYNRFFLLTYPNCSYFFTLFKFYDKNKKYFGKITMWHFQPLRKSQISIYNKFNNIIVFNEEQKIFWIQENLLNNTICMDIMVLNESNLLNLPLKEFEKDYIVFGYLGRISREKNIEDMLRLLCFLNNKNRNNCKLIIQGEGDFVYFKELELLIDTLNLKNFVEINNKFISPLETHFFYKRVEVFLVTSTIEGGPMTSLEAAAGGSYVIGYNIGAMNERFGGFPYVVNENFDILCHSALTFLALSKYEKQIIVKEFRDFYKMNLSNSKKALNFDKLLE